jgi:hypothetical protein
VLANLPCTCPIAHLLRTVKEEIGGFLNASAASFRHEWFNRLFGTARRSAIRHMWIAERSIITFLHRRVCGLLLDSSLLDVPPKRRRREAYPLKKKKPQKDTTPARLGQFWILKWMSSPRSARAKVAGTLFSTQMAKPVALLPEEPLVSEVQGLLNSVTNVIECATGGHGRCVDSACRCHCHKPRVPVPFKQQMSF